MIEDQAHQPAYVFVKDLFCKQAEQDLMVNTREKLADVTLENILVLARVLRTAVQGFVAPLTHSVCIRGPGALIIRGFGSSMRNVVYGPG